MVGGCGTVWTCAFLMCISMMRSSAPSLSKYDVSKDLLQTIPGTSGSESFLAAHTSPATGGLEISGRALRV